jgi:hypothetical protein
MKRINNVREAQEHALQGGQALHVYGALDMPAPAVFKRHKTWAHLFDQDKGRLIKTARRLGVRVIKVHHEGRRGQHIDLCGRPLERAQEQAEP